MGLLERFQGRQEQAWALKGGKEAREPYMVIPEAGQWEGRGGLRGASSSQRCFVKCRTDVCVFSWEPPRAFIELSGDQSVAQKH